MASRRSKHRFFFLFLVLPDRCDDTTSSQIIIFPQKWCVSLRFHNLSLLHPACLTQISGIRTCVFFIFCDQFTFYNFQRWTTDIWNLRQLLKYPSLSFLAFFAFIFEMDGTDQFQNHRKKSFHFLVLKIVIHDTGSLAQTQTTPNLFFIPNFERVKF